MDRITKKINLEGLEGWLILVGIGIFMFPIMALAKLIPIYSKMFSDGSWKALMTQGTDSFHPLWTPFLISEIALNLGFILVFIFAAYLFFSKKRNFPKCYNGVLVLHPVFILFDAIALKLILPNEPIIDPDTGIQLVLALANMSWIPYLLISRRVKATFVNNGVSLVDEIPLPSKTSQGHEHFQQREIIEAIKNTPAQKKINDENDDKIIYATQVFDSWTEDFKFLNDYDPVVAKCNYELERLDHRLSRKFREEVISDRNRATDIKDRLMVEYEKKVASDNLTEVLAIAHRLGPLAVEEFNRVVEVMGEDIELDLVTQQLIIKFGKIRNKFSYRGYEIIRNAESNFNIFKAGVRVKGSIDYTSIKVAKAYIDHFDPK
jgi:hypothetical protein